MARWVVGPSAGLARFGFALGSFHAAVLVALGVMLAYRLDGLDGLGDLNTGVGLALFALLWWSSVYGTRWALRGVRDHSLAEAIVRSMLGGAVAGLAFVGLVFGTALVVTLGVLVGSAAAEGDVSGWEVALLVPLYGVIAAAIAAAVGAAIGWVFGVLDWVILALAGIGNGFDPGKEVRHA